MSTWRVCSSCKKPIPHGSTYWVCSVSTCNRARSPFVFCSPRCWDAHVPVMNHRSAWCEERRAPREGEEEAAPRQAEVRAAAPRTAEPRPAEPRHRDEPLRRAMHREPEPGESDVLIVASRLKDYIDRRAGMNTSAEVLQALSDIVRRETDRAIERAREDGRKTVKARDFRGG